MFFLLDPCFSEALKEFLMKYLLLVLLGVVISSCATQRISTCKSMCSTDKVDIYQDEDVTCKCRTAKVTGPAEIEKAFEEAKK